MHTSPDDAETESGIVYLVENKHGQRKFVRRPAPPPTSSPLEEDFDRATTLPTTSPKIKTRYGNTKSPWSANDLAGSASPLDDDFDAFTYTVAGGGRDPAVSTLDGRDRVIPRRSESRNENRNESRNESRRVLPIHQPAPISPPRRENVHIIAHGTHGYGRRHAEARAMTDVRLSPLRRPQDMESIVPLERSGQTKISKPSKLGSSTKPPEQVTHDTPDTVSPRTGQSFEIVNRRIVEDGPERTVLISTWREQVANATDGREGMDVYYLNAADYAAETAVDPTACEETESPVRRKAIMPPPVHVRHNSDEKSNPESIRSIPDEGEISPERPRKMSVQTIPPEDSRPPQRSGSAQSWNKGHISPPSGIELDRHRVNRSPSGPKNRSNGYPVPGMQSPPPRSSTPLQHNSTDRLTHMHGSGTPHRAAYAAQTSAPLASFHPTQSGATISTIKSAGMDSAVAFENVLASCEPPLLHIAPALANLGIVNEGHLRAIARLSEETRDKEVREEALKQGITVMEWAILLDRLQKL